MAETILFRGSPDIAREKNWNYIIDGIWSLIRM